MELREEIDRDLRQTNLSRNRFAYTIQLCALVLSVWYQTGFHDSLNGFILATGLSGFLLRFFATEVIFDDQRGSDAFLWLGFFLLSMAWTLHVDQALRLQGATGETIPLLGVILGGIILLNNAFLVADVISYYIFLVPVGIGILIEIFFMKNLNDPYSLISFFILSVLVSFNLQFQHRQLRSFITSRIEAQREKKRLRKIIDSVPGFVAMISKDGQFFDANQSALKVWPELIGTKLDGPTQNSEYSKTLQEFFHSGKETLTLETQAIIQGDLNHLMTTMGRLPDGGIIVCAIPINELVKTRKDLRDQEALALYSSKLASIGQMAAGVAHEVNNPLAIIQGAATIISSIIEQEPLDKKNLKHFSNKIVKTSERIAQIVRSLRTLSRGGEKDPFAPLSLQAIISSCIDISAQKLKMNDIRLIFADDKKDITIMGREVQLGQVILNLLMNAIDAIKNLEDRWVQIDFGHSDGQAWVEVIDSGLGISPEIAEKIMNPFFTTKDKDNGTGLGLSISSQILEEHGGKLVYLADRKNTTFRLYFPTPKL